VDIKRFDEYIESNPKHLLRLMAAGAAISIIAILILATFGIHRVYSRQIIANAEDDAVQTSKALLSLEKEVIIDPVRGQILLNEKEVEQLDSRFRKFLHPFNIVKIKIFDRQNRIVYSTDRTIIGQVDNENLRLARAMAGYNDSKLEKKEQVLDLANETKIDVDVVETYVPIRNGRGEVIGSFEIYRDVTRYRTEIFAALRKSILLLALILLAVFSGALWVVKIGTDQLLIAQHRLREMATRDPLTGILNRREIFRRADHEIERGDRRDANLAKESLGIIMLDIDRFKQVNDTYGHTVGDQVLKEVAGRIQGSIREYDFVGRYGGEEFLIIMPCTSLAETAALAERIRSAIRETPFSFAEHSCQITASLGIAITGDGPQRFGLALERADEGLYLAKNAGRDQVAWVPQHPARS
jgi:diguanylate cyclase (GGDEF)-like protein